jgi:hypothetical protein
MSLCSMHRSVLAQFVMARGPCEVRRQMAATQSFHSPRLVQEVWFAGEAAQVPVSPNFGTAVGEPDWDQGPQLPANSGASCLCQHFKSTEISTSNPSREHFGAGLPYSNTTRIDHLHCLLHSV